MLKPSCARARRLLLESEGGLLGQSDGLWLEDHLGRCPACHAEGRDLSRILSAWREQPAPPLRSGHRDRLEAALLAAPPVATEPTAEFARPRRGRILRWVAKGAAAAAIAATVALGVLFWPRGDEAVAPSLAVALDPLAAREPAPGLEILAFLPGGGDPGMSAAGARMPSVAWNHELVVPSGGALRLRVARAGIRVGLGGDTRARFAAEGRKLRLTLHQGSVALEVPPSAGWRVVVQVGPGASVEVVGTRFLVTRTPGGEVSVLVTRGTVLYRHLADGRRGAVTLRAGQRLTHAPEAAPVIGTQGADPTMALLDAPLAALAATPRPAPRVRVSKDAADTPPGRGASTSRPPITAGLGCRPATLRALRLRLAAPELLARLDQCRRAGRAGRELRVIEAETLLRAGQTGLAASRYQEIARAHRGSLAAENALLAAAQILRFRLGRRAEADRLCRQYLREYPRGLHRDEMKRLLE